MKKAVLILVALGILVSCAFFLLCPPYPQLWNQISFGMERAEIERMAKQAGGERTPMDRGMEAWEVKRGLGRFSIQVTFSEEKAALLHCQYRSDVVSFFDRARNKQREYH